MNRIAVLLAGAALGLNGCAGLTGIFSEERSPPPAPAGAADTLTVAPNEASGAGLPPLPRPKPAITNDEVLTLQIGLQRLGFEPGPADGILGPLTQEAVRKFQRSLGLEADGTVTRTLVWRVSTQLAESGSTEEPDPARQKPAPPAAPTQGDLLKQLSGS